VTAFVRLPVITPMSTKMTIFWDVAQCSSVDIYRILEVNTDFIIRADCHLQDHSYLYSRGKQFETCSGSLKMKQCPLTITSERIV
jgi:hypothetical protein